ncbi:iron transporter, partial [Staphylococcus aureus]|nr:iron transporter [Staphylococcus aureus]
MNSRYVRALTLLSLIPTSVFALEYPVGQPIIKNGMEIQGVYLQPITMDTEEGHHAMKHLP